MTLVSAGVLQSAFEAGDTPTSADFKRLLDSFVHRVSAAGTADIVKGLGASDYGVERFQAGTTASAQGHIGAGALGTDLLEVGTTASALNHLNVGTLGQDLFEVGTTASAQGHIGGGAAGIGLFEAATTASVNSQIAGVEQASTAQAVAGSALGVYMSPQQIRESPFAIRAYAAFTCAAAITQSKRVSGATREAAGRFKITFAPALPTSNYVVIGGAHSYVNGSILGANVNPSSPPTVSAVEFDFIHNAATLKDPNDMGFFMVACSGA